MKTILAAIAFFLTASPQLSSVRSMYEKAATGEKHCKEMLDTLKGIDEDKETLMAGYKGCATMIMAKYAFNPFSKLSYFTKGKKILEAAIAKDTANTELRYLRYTVQQNAPGFLGYADDLKKDKAFLQRKLPGLNDSYLRSAITKALTK